MFEIGTSFHGPGTGDIRCLTVASGTLDAPTAPPSQSRSRLAGTRLAVDLVKLLFGPLDDDAEEHLINVPSLAEFLLASYMPLQASFGHGATFRVRLFVDPESDEKTMFVGTLTALPVPEALKALRSFDDFWFLERVGEVAGQINFTVDFV